MSTIRKLLRETDRELLLIPYDGRWEARLTIYNIGGTPETLSAYDGDPEVAIELVAEKARGK